MLGQNQRRHINDGMLKLNFDCIVLTDKKNVGSESMQTLTSILMLNTNQ
jgi:hypothetical protein